MVKKQRQVPQPCSKPLCSVTTVYCVKNVRGNPFWNPFWFDDWMCLIVLACVCLLLQSSVPLGFLLLACLGYHVLPYIYNSRLQFKENSTKP